MKFDKQHTSEICFPLGGIGAGNISLAGNGELVDWEIFNAPSKKSRNGMTHFALRTEKDGKVLDARILQGDIPEFHYTGIMRPSNAFYRGYGWGPDSITMCGFPHFRSHSFEGEFPFATVNLGGEDACPAAAKVNAWSPFIPGDDKNSSIPAAFFDIEITNTRQEKLDYTLVFVLGNPWENPEKSNHWQDGRLLMDNGLEPDAFEKGELACQCLEPNEALSYQEYFFRGESRDAVETYWYDLNQPGHFQNRRYSTPRPGREHALIAAHFSLQPGESHTVHYVLSWYVPNRKNDWNRKADERCAAAGIENRWKNWYATEWSSAADVCRYAVENRESLLQKSRLFQQALFSSTLPPEVLDAISSNLAVLKSPTCLRLEDGTFYGWEGVGITLGSCEGSCVHVWNYQQALPFLFPSLERSMRESHWTNSIDEAGGSHFRLNLPLGIKATREMMRPCVDGQMGDIMKAYREWHISGDDTWLKKWYPVMKKTLEYAWSKDNYDRWDPQQSGVITGRQHHTLDLELFGPNAWLEGHYLGALKAMAEMATAVGDESFAQKCTELFNKGHQWTEEHLFNGSYYCQQIDLTDKSQLESYEMGGNDTRRAVDTYWDDEHKQVKYQVGSGCEIDMQLAQWYATLYGIGPIFDTQRHIQALRALYENNYLPTLRDKVNQWRIYALNDEGGLRIATWPKGVTAPVIPIQYASEMMTGFEYAAAGNMICSGLLEQGLSVVRSIRHRFDGAKRNPWNEFECGNNYARSMASYGLLLSYSGFRFNACEGMLGFHPVIQAASRFFWSLGTVWGTVECRPDSARLEILSGTYLLKKLELDFAPQKSELNGKEVHLPVELKPGDCLDLFA